MAPGQAPGIPYAFEEFRTYPEREVGNCTEPGGGMSLVGAIRSEPMILSNKVEVKTSCMKLFRAKRQSESGSVLVTTMVITFVIGLTLASFLVLTQHQTFANARSQSWNHTMAVTECGVEDALQMINKYCYDSAKLLDWAADISAGGSGADYWAYVGNNTYKSVRSVGQPVQAVYEVWVTNSRPNAPTIRADGTFFYDYQYDHSPMDYYQTEGTTPITVASVGTTAGRFSTAQLKRSIVVHTQRDALWALAMLADREIDLNGNVVTTDSFNSADPSMSDWSWTAYATYGLFDPTKRNDRGDVATNLKLIDSLNTGNAKIRGHASTGPGGTVAIGPNGAVGSEDWLDSGSTGVEPGYSSDDMNVRLTEVGLPLTTWFALPTEGKGGTNINGVTYKHVILTGGDYQASTLQGSLYVGPGVDARVYLTDSVSLLGLSEIRIDPAAVRLTIYMAGSKFTLGGGGLVNETARAESFLYFGLPSNTELNLLGNGDFTGAIYAPQADFTLGGGGKTVYDFVGASVTRTVTMNGSYHFHYDEDLANIGPSRGFIPTSWAEISKQL